MPAPVSPSSETKNIAIRFAQSRDVASLARLINRAFVVERPFIAGERIDPPGIQAYLEKGKFLVAEDVDGLAGCVYLELRGERGYLGLLGVEPGRQGTGLGRKLMEAAENYFRTAHCRAIDLRIISPREPLARFYAHLGYTETGTAPFAPDVPLKVPCHYILMSKSLLRIRYGVSADCSRASMSSRTASASARLSTT